MEIMNRISGTLLRGLVRKTQKDWNVKFAYNHSHSFATGHSLFEVVYGVSPYLALDLILLPKEELVHKDAEEKLKSIIKLHQ